MIDSDAITEAKRALGHQLAACREAAGFNQHRLAEEITFGRSTIANVETGYSTCSRTFWERCDHALRAGGALLRGYDDLQALIGVSRMQAAELAEAKRVAKFRELHAGGSLADDNQSRSAVADARSPAGKPRTLLEYLIRESDRTYEEWAEEFARRDGLVAISARHLGRLARGERDDAGTTPATRRALTAMFGIPARQLLAPYRPEDDPDDLQPPAALEPAPLAARDRAEQAGGISRAQFADRLEEGVASRPSTVDVVALSTLEALPRVGSGDESELDELEALELAQRVTASDVGPATLLRLEAIVDDIATKYSVTPPAELLRRARQYLSYVKTLVGARKTLDEHRRLLVVGAWLSLLAATLHIDLKQGRAASARLQTSAALAEQVGHDELRAWVLETEAWRVLTNGNYRRALELSQAAQRIGPAGSSVAIQATAQEGRAWSRLGQAEETYDAIQRVTKFTDRMPRPDRPEHHYQYDPDKAVSYTATTLAWLGDSAAESYAREVIARLSKAEKSGKWPRRLAVAKLDLSLALLASNEGDEASATALEAIVSGRVVPSNHWRALEVVAAVESRGLPEGRDLREAFEELRRGRLGDDNRPAISGLPD
ncbi:helix-turn-helix domain-containing protein [Phytohabitans suffuscus]|nr:helix-turn-helix transcriptional regulator [Phytohabitans suffuscus]